MLSQASYILRSIIIAISVLLLFACGGGGSNGDENSDDGQDNEVQIDTPQNTVAMSGDGQVTVSWNAVTGAESYIIRNCAQLWTPIYCNTHLLK
jgi:hypothetical protein